ncbi:MAG: hypothetical protein ACLGGU_00280 [Gammaproteobacteria bacterium]
MNLAKESVEYSSGDVLTLYGIIIAVVLAIAIVGYKTATKKKF